MTGDGGDFPLVDERLRLIRGLRERLERAVLPLATSLDGRRFTVQASLHDLRLRPGGYVVLDTGAGRRLGLLESLELARETAVDLALPAEGAQGASGSSRIAIRLARGEGRLLDADRASFHDARVEHADPQAVAAWLAGAGAPRSPLPVGTLSRAPDVPYAIDARGFDRHTFFCGQSGSGKTYSLGVVLEQILLRTRLRVIVLDPNSDFIHLREPRPEVDAQTAARWREATAGVTVHGQAGAAHARLALRFAELDPSAHAALLRLDPIGEREEYAELVDLVTGERPDSIAALDERAAGSADGHRLAVRARNLGVDGFSVWAADGGGSLLERLEDDDWRCLVVDLGSLGGATEQALVSQALLGRLWARRERREPVLVVVDEAHNVCPAQPRDELTALATETAVRIAAEGRKFGLYLLVATQRPQKVHREVVSQCDNLVLMRLNSSADADHAADAFSFVPRSLVHEATGFTLGEALVGGRIAQHPAIVRFGARVAREGGADVPADWA
ncbi:MAG: ATP-binding protein [Solirubrobacteraceae bacterium]|nr:ATP-binding protein [Solirubrobacteraceae bacterium]